MLRSVVTVAWELWKGDWPRNPARLSTLRRDVEQLHGDLASHAGTVEGAGGILDSVVAECSHPGSRARRLSMEHLDLQRRLAYLAESLRFCDGSHRQEHVVRCSAFEILTDLNAHQVGGNAMLLEAYHTDLNSGG